MELRRPKEPRNLADLPVQSLKESYAGDVVKMLQQEDIAEHGEARHTFRAVPDPRDPERYVIEIRTVVGELLGYW